MSLESLDFLIGQLVDVHEGVAHTSRCLDPVLCRKVGDGACTERDYLLTLPDGRSLTIGMWALASGETAPSDAALTDFAAHVISTLRPRS